MNNSEVIIMKKQTSMITVVIFCLFVGFLIFYGIEKKKEARIESEQQALIEAQRKAFWILWDKTEILMSTEDFLKLYPDAIEDTSRGYIGLKYYNLSTPRIITDNSYNVEFEFHSNALRKVTLSLDEKAAKSIWLSDYAYQLYYSLELKYGRPSDSYIRNDFDKKKYIFTKWFNNLAVIALTYLDNPETPVLAVVYGINTDLLQAYNAQQNL